MEKLTVNIIDYGSSAEVIDLGNDRVLKAYLRKPHADTAVLEWEDHDAMTRAEFRAEARSYERLQAFPELKIFAPRYFGRVDPIEMLPNFSEAKSRYVAGCGLLLEYIPGVAIKISQLEPSVQPRVESVLERFAREVGMPHVWDGSCFVPGTRSEFTVVDFATWDNFTDYIIELKQTGRLSHALRARLELENAD